jgi:DNA-binding NarL/FixJ family response regulator
MRALLERYPSLTVVAEADSEDSAVAAALETRPDIILMDIRLAGGSGIDACYRIVRQNSGAKVIMLTSYAEDELLFSAIRAGAVGYVLKQVGSGELIRAIEAAARGEGALDPSLTQRVLSEVRRSIQKDEAAAFTNLSDQEKQVLALIAAGNTNRTIAQELFLSQGTVRNYVSSLLAKLDLSNRAEAAAYAIKHRLNDHLNSS